MYFFYCVLQNGTEIFVMDIIDEVSSDILSNALRNISPEDKVSCTAHAYTRVIDFLLNTRSLFIITVQGLHAGN